MKILFVSLFLPQKLSTHAGGRYVFELLSQLAQRHEVHLATRLEEEELPQLESLRPICAKIHPFTYRTVAKRGVLDKLRLIGNYLAFSRFADRLIREGDYDLAQVEWVETALFIRRGKTPLVLDAHDVISKPAARAVRQSSGPGRLLAWLKYLLVRAMERSIVRRFDAVLTLSDFDRDFLLNMEPGLPVSTVPIPAGLDITERQYPARPNTLLFLASYKYRRVNVDAALYFYHEVFPRVRAALPQARFIAAGYGPPEELTSLAERDHAVEVPGFVDDLDRCCKEAAVFVAPILTGGGIIVKILDALAAGTPVVTTSYGNEGINAQPGRDLLVADDPQAFAEAVLRLLTDPSFARTLADNGRRFVREQYGLESVVERIEACHRGVAGRRHSRPPR
ncbi:glycosyltransferase family 4 protein [Geomonas sp.]|uniref:glycosyltransferase family 4 protein n=1 Tax=Geomonas sp. TaxID=2651584 RepID=UPI002B47CBF7|nr:glycosyltransferase family 4 protein [Geomonas sp.]HJV34181.1 glycosyltransferase family 4 protein [Geomonas sp.]